MAEVALVLDRVGRVFGTGRDQVTALADVRFTVAAGQIVGLLGSNDNGADAVVVMPNRPGRRLRLCSAHGGVFDDVEDAHVWGRFPALKMLTTSILGGSHS